MRLWSAVLLFVPMALQAQLNRAAVSVTGLDTNPCTPASPCRSFGQAMTQTNPGGEIIAINSGGFGPVTANKSVRIAAAPGVYAGISVPAMTAGVTVSAGSSDVVVVRGLTITNVGGPVAIELLFGKRLYIENCVIQNFGNAVYSQNGNLVVTDTTFRIVFNAIETYAGKSLVDHTTITNVSNIAVQAGETATVTARNVVVTSSLPGYGGTAFSAHSSAGTATLNIEGSAVFNNYSGATTTTGGLIRVSNSAMTGNTKGLFVAAGAIETFGNNRVRGNTTDVDGLTTPVGQD